MKSGRFWLALVVLLAAVAVGFAARTPGWTAADADLAGVVEAVRTPWVTAVAQVLNVGFGTVVGTFLVVLLVAGTALAQRVAKAVQVAVVVIAGWGTSAIVKVVVARPRPPSAHALVQEVGSDSFPSGHVCLTLSLVIALALLLKAHRRAILALGAVLVLAQMLARLYLGAHYPTDTIGSLMVSPAAIYLVRRLPTLGRSCCARTVTASRRAPGAAGRASGTLSVSVGAAGPTR